MTISELAAWAQPILTILEPLLVPVVTWAMWAGVAELRRHGWQTTYAEAIPRAMGAGVIAAQKQGLDPFSAAGRVVVAAEGTSYLSRFVGEQADKLGITDATHGERVLAQLGVAAGEAQAAVIATAATVAQTIQPAAAVLQAATAITDAVGASMAMVKQAQPASADSGPPGDPPNAGSGVKPPPYYPPGAR